MIVWGLVAGHKVLAIHDSFYPSPINSSPASYVRALAIAAGVHDMGERDDPMDVDDACQVLQAKVRTADSKGVAVNGINIEFILKE